MTVSSTLPLGFEWASATAGIKSSGNADLALARCQGGAAAAAMFTANHVVAAPVTVGRRHLAATAGRVTAVVVNSGNANCATGAAGLDAAHRCCVAVAEQCRCVFDEVIPSSTGIIGVPFPLGKLLAAVPGTVATLGSTAAHAEAFANAILTTDTRAKIARADFSVDGRVVSLFGCAKGAGMIGPQLGAPPAPPHATMLCYLFTDLDATAPQLQTMLGRAVEASFNSCSIDGDTSTNDTVLLLASAASGVKADDGVAEAFQTALDLVTASLAHQIVDDGEGVTHVVTLDITGCHTDADAKQIARTIATSPLCKTAWSSADPNWGRLLAAAGRAGVHFTAEDVTVRIADLPVFAAGMRDPAYDEAATHAAMSRREYTISMDFGTTPAAGQTGECRFLTCDLTHEYVSINADYSS